MKKKLNTGKLVQNLIAIALVVAAFLAVRALLGTRQLMYLTATSVDHVNVLTMDTGVITATTTGDDTAGLVKLLSKAVFHGAAQGEPAAPATHLQVCKKDGSQLDLVVCEGQITVDGSHHKIRTADSAAILAWSEEICSR